MESELGRGSSFFIYLPASSPQDQRKMGKVSFAKGRRILIMDDEKGVCNILEKMLKSMSYEVEVTTNGTEAVEIYKQAQESGRRFDAVILDLTIPGGIGGKETVRKLLEINPKIKAIVSSGYSNDPIISDFKNYGFSGVIAKPFCMNDLKDVLWRVIKQD